MNDSAAHEEARAFVMQLLAHAGLETTLNREDVRQLIQAAEMLLMRYVRVMPQQK